MTSLPLEDQSIKESAGQKMAEKSGELGTEELGAVLDQRNGRPHEKLSTCCSIKQGGGKGQALSLIEKERESERKTDRERERGGENEVSRCRKPKRESVPMESGSHRDVHGVRDRDRDRDRGACRGALALIKITRER